MWPVALSITGSSRLVERPLDSLLSPALHMAGLRCFTSAWVGCWEALSSVRLPGDTAGLLLAGLTDGGLLALFTIGSGAEILDCCLASAACMRPTWLPFGIPPPCLWASAVCTRCSASSEMRRFLV